MGVCPVSGGSSRQTLRQDTIFSSVPPATEVTVLQPPFGPASPPSTTAMRSVKEQKIVKSLNSIGFPEAQRIPTRLFQSSSSVVRPPAGSSHGTQVLMESVCFLFRRMAETSFWSCVASFYLSRELSVVQRAICSIISLMQPAFSKMS